MGEDQPAVIHRGDGLVVGVHAEVDAKANYHGGQPCGDPLEPGLPPEAVGQQQRQRHQGQVQGDAEVLHGRAGENQEDEAPKPGNQGDDDDGDIPFAVGGPAGVEFLVHIYLLVKGSHQ